MPRFNTATGPGMYAEGLSGFIPGVVAQVYPLRADLVRLQEFCDAYLNFIGEEDRPPVYFRAALPCVLLGILNYPRMAFTGHNMGWLSQHEIVFDVPLEWYAVENERLVFKDWALFTPFIYVDNPLSIEGGREVYGWPKSAAQLLPADDAPSAAGRPSRFFALGVPEPGRRYGGRIRTLLELRREARGEGPLSALPDALVRSATALWGSLASLAGAPVFGYERPPDLYNLFAMARRGLDYAGNLMSGFLFRPSAAPQHSGRIELDSPLSYLNYITLKQFRDAEVPELACYQALVRSKIVAARLNHVSLSPLVPPDLTCGVSVGLHRLPDHPIIESLGLEVSEETVRGDTRVATLRPAFPFWLNADLGYSTGEVLSWRTAHGAWRAPKPAPSRDRSASLSTHRPASPLPLRSRYNTALGRATQEIRGPFDYPAASVRVLPLMADAARLAQFCRAYLDNQRYRFEPWGSYTYFVLIGIDELSSETDEFSLRAVRDATFALPVKWYDADGRLLSIATVSPFAYINNETAVITLREVSGLGATAARFEMNRRWIGSDGEERERERLLTISAMIFPKFDVGAEARECKLIEVLDGDPLPADDAQQWARVAEDWGGELLADYRRKHCAARAHPRDFKNARVLALEILARGAPINSIGLKQFRDVAHYQYACYQALVLAHRYIDRISSLDEDNRRKVHLHIHRYAMQPVVELLGLKVKWTKAGGEVPVDVLEPIRPFRAQISLRERLGKNICQRTTRQWRYDDEPRTPFFGCGGGAPAPLTADEAVRAVERIEPQMVIEAMLSRGLKSLAAEPAPGDRPLRRKPDFALRADSIGAAAPVAGWPPPAPLSEVQPGLYAAPQTSRSPAARKPRSKHEST